MAQVPSKTASAPLIKSKARVAQHGEVFTPPRLVEAMLDLVEDETKRIEARFLEPACGSGNFLVPILERKLKAVDDLCGPDESAKRLNALYALMCIYGIEILGDNVQECRENLIETFASFLDLEDADPLLAAAAYVLSVNILHGDACAMRMHDGSRMAFVEWQLEGDAFKSRRVDFEAMTQANYGQSASSAQASLFSDGDPQEHRSDRNQPFEVYTIDDLSALASGVVLAEGA